MKKIEIKYSDTWFYTIVVMIAVCMPIFFIQIYEQGYSDIGPHSDFALVMFDKTPQFLKGMPIQAYTYPIYHILYKVFYSILFGNKVLAAAILLSFCSLSAILVTRFCLNKIWDESESSIKKYGVDILSIASIFFIGIVGPLTEGRYYVGQGAPNLWHNPTYLLMRPFAWITFVWACVVLKDIINNENEKKNIILFSILSVVICLIKPSFTIVLLPAAAMITLWGMLKLKTFKIGFKMLLYVAPTLVTLIVQYAWVWFNPSVRDTSEQFCFTLGSYNGFDFGQSIGVFLALNLINILVLIPEGRKWIFKDFYYTMGLFITVVGSLEFFFLSDGSAGNFAWGYYAAVQISTLLSIGKSVQSKRKWLYIPIVFIFLYQVGMGLIYLLQYYRGGQYLI